MTDRLYEFCELCGCTLNSEGYHSYPCSALMGESAPGRSDMMTDEQANEIEQLLGLNRGDTHFWYEYYTNPYLHAAVKLALTLRAEKEEAFKKGLKEGTLREYNRLRDKI